MKPVVLVILDGFGLSPIANGNAIMTAKTPFLDWAIAKVPKTLLHASGAEVGLDWGEMGNSEVGHLNIGTGRIVMQDLPRINRAIEDKTFFANQALLDASQFVHQRASTLHIIGLASSGGVHAHIQHMLAMLDFAKQQGLSDVALHLISDGRDTQPETIQKDLPTIEEAIKRTEIGRIASISGRYFAMDRDKRWDRTGQAYAAIVEGKGKFVRSAAEAIETARTAKETDEFISPTTILGDDGKPVAVIEPDDAVIFTNFRPDRARQLATALTVQEFTDFPRPNGPVGFFASFTSYGQEASPSVKVAFFAPPTANQLAQVVAEAKLKQLHIAETEKYAHVTYFLNGGREEPFPLEERVLVPSPKVATYDLKPQMSAVEIVDEFTKRIKQTPALMVINFANPDMVGHTGNLQATIQAVETVDTQLLRVLELTRTNGATLIVTADHGNAEQLIHPETGEIDKEHTTNPVPLFLIEPELTYETVEVDADKIAELQFAAQPAAGVLADVGPTVLDYLELPKPSDMTGQSLKGLL